MILRDGGKIISDREKVADTFNKFFVNIGNTLKIDKVKRFLFETNDVFDPALKAIKKYSAHPSILNIKEKMTKTRSLFKKSLMNKFQMKLTVWTLQNQHSQRIFPLR